MVNFYYKSVKNSRLEVLNKFKTGSWVYVEDPTDEEMKSLRKKLRLKPGLLKDALDPNEVPRMEVDGKTTYVFTRIPYDEDGKIFTLPILLMVGEDFVATITRKPLPFLNKFIKGKIKFFTTQKTKLFLQLFAEINASFNSHLTGISRRVRTMTFDLEKINNKDIIQFVHLEGYLNDFISALVPTNTILNNLLSGKYLKLYEEDKDLTEDLLLANGQFIESCKAILKNIVNIREAHSTIVTNNLNRVIKLLTALTVILTVPTIIASIYGMNVKLPFADNPWAFFLVVGITLLTSAVFLFVFIKNNWL
jgi:magnesium transporter